MKIGPQPAFNPFACCARSREISKLLDVSAARFETWQSNPTSENWERWQESRREIDGVQRGVA